MNRPRHLWLQSAPRPAQGPATSGADAAWRWARLTTAPHRVAFFAGGAVWAVSSLWWLAVLGAREASLPVPWAVAPPVAHGLLMALSFLPLFMTGFLYTAGPRWLGLPDVPGTSLARPVAGYAAAWALFAVGVHAHAALAAAGVAMAAVVWLGWMRRFARLVAASRMPDRLHARLILGAGTVGGCAMAAAAAALALGHTAAVRAAIAVALWGFVAPVFVTVSHRMLPFFTHSAIPAIEPWRPHAILVGLLGVMGLTGAASAAELLGAVLPVPIAAAVMVAHLVTGAFVLWLAFRWGMVRSLSVKLLAMLHGGFVWLGLAFVLAAASEAGVLTGARPEGLGLAPLHALTVGFLGATLVAMVTRVAAGHSGRPLVADRLAVLLYAGVQLAAVMRVASAVWPGQALALLAAAAAWTAAACAWAWRYGGWMGRPRTDGRPG